MKHLIYTVALGLSMAVVPLAGARAAGTGQTAAAQKTAGLPGDPLVRAAATRQTPPWTNDSANINNQRTKNRGALQPAAPVDPQDFTVTEDMKNRFSDSAHVFGTTGAEIFAHSCQACHMAGGQGAQGAGYYPKLVDNPRLVAPQYPMAIVLNGLHGMPPFRGKLSDEQIAAVVNYLIVDLNHHEQTISAQDVAAVRQPLDSASSY